MNAAGARDKGIEFEIKVCKRLSLWISGGSKKDIFVRSGGSGAPATISTQKGHDRGWGGDVVAIHELGYKLTDLFTIECKHNKDLELDRILKDPDDSVLGQFWQQTERQTVNGRSPLLIARQNYKPIQLAFRFDTQSNHHFKVLDNCKHLSHFTIIKLSQERHIALVEFEQALSSSFPLFVYLVKGRYPSV